MISISAIQIFYYHFLGDTVTAEQQGTNYMSTIPVVNGDVVGIVLQQSDLPMLQFMLNGEMIYSASMNRFRGTVYPSVYIPIENNDDNKYNHYITNLLEIIKWVQREVFRIFATT